MLRPLCPRHGKRRPGKAAGERRFSCSVDLCVLITRREAPQSASQFLTPPLFVLLQQIVERFLKEPVGGALFEYGEDVELFEQSDIKRYCEVFSLRYAVR